MELRIPSQTADVIKAYVQNARCFIVVYILLIGTAIFWDVDEREMIKEVYHLKNIEFH